MSIGDQLDRARQSFVRRAWGDAYAQLSAVDRERPLAPDDVERLAMAAHLIGRDADSIDLWTRAYHELVTRGDPERAARCVFWLAFCLLLQGEPVHSSGWLARARRLLDDGQHDCVEQGYLLVPGALRHLHGGDPAAAYAAGCQIATIAARFNDPDLLTHSLVLRGRALIRLRRAAEGMALLDEIMVAITTGEISPIVAGLAYCAVIEACQEVFDLRRAQEWTAALNHWCVSQPGLVPYRGQCLVYRAELMRLHGAWPEAIHEAQRACERLPERLSRLWAGAAFYQQAEIKRLCGQFTSAEEAYGQAASWGQDPQPGLALLWLVQGRVAAAAAAISRAVEEARDPAVRARLLAPYVEIKLAAHEVAPARTAADELSNIAAALDAPFLHAVSAQATGAVLLSEGQAGAALATLRHAWRIWQELGAPYEAMRVRVLIGVACRELGDEDTAEMELQAAREVFRQLGALPDLTRVEALSRKAVARAVSGLTARELQVLRLVAAGQTNHEIATALIISDHTVRRHLQNIFAKLDVPSRAAATAFAFQHDLI